METASRMIPFPLLKDPASYTPCTINYEKEGVSKVWLDVFRRSIPSFKARAEKDDSVKDADVRAARFALRFGEILDDLEKDPEKHGGPPNCVLLVQLREQVLREVGFEDIFRKVKAEENATALELLPKLLKEIDATEDKGARIEMVVKGVFAGNIFDLGAGKAEQETGKLDFKKSFEDLLPRPWAIDNFDELQKAWLTGSPTYSKAVVFVDNSGADIMLGIIPLAREMIRHGTRVVLAANDLPAINDITYNELSDIVHKIDDDLLQEAIDNGSLLVVNSGSDLPVLDLTSVSPELAWVAEDADLVVFEGMGRGIETNLYAQLKVDSLNLGMIKHKEVAEYLKGRMYDCVCKYTRVPRPNVKASSQQDTLPSPKQHVLSGVE